MADNRDLDGQFQRIWTRQLRREFEEICWRYQVKLPIPIFEISDSKSRLGSWQADLQLIRLSSHLIRRSWAATLNVLKHEMAHQLCSELGHDLGKPHGQAFQEACQRLGVPLEYRGADSDLSHHNEQSVEGPADGSGQALIRKIEKLLALAQSANENEAALAMEKANQLLDHYNLRQLLEDRERGYTVAIIDHHKKRIEGYQKKIGVILNNFFHVKVVYSTLYDPLTNVTHKTIELLGARENVQVAEYCYHFLENQLRILWRQEGHRHRKGRTVIEKNSYYLGVLQGFSDTLKKQQENRATKMDPGGAGRETGLTLSSLMVGRDRRLAEYIKQRFPRLASRCHHGPKVYAHTFSEGMKTGNRLVFHKGVSEGGNSHGKLLGQ